MFAFSETLNLNNNHKNIEICRAVKRQSRRNGDKNEEILKKILILCVFAVIIAAGDT